MGFLDKGSVLQHNHLGYIVRINEIRDGDYVLGWVEEPERRIQNFLLRGPWSAVDLVREFRPHVVHESRWDRLLNDGNIFGEEPYPQE